jgi:hypothetical protein
MPVCFFVFIWQAHRGGQRGAVAAAGEGTGVAHDAGLAPHCRVVEEVVAVLARRGGGVGTGLSNNKYRLGYIRTESKAPASSRAVVSEADTP